MPPNQVNQLKRKSEKIRLRAKIRELEDTLTVKDR